MADSSDIETSLGTLLSGIFYPNGTGSASLLGSPVTIMRGWPTVDTINQAAIAQTNIVAVHADPAMSRNVSRYPRNWQATAAVCTLVATLSNLTITLSGTPALGQAIAAVVKGVAYAYALTATDTLSSTASAFAALIPGATASGAVITIPSGGAAPQVATVASTTAQLEVARQQAVFRLCCWAPSPTIRDSVFSSLPGNVAYYGSRLSLPDGSTATWMGQSETGPDDMPARQAMWRRDLLVTYDWPVVASISVQSAAALLTNYTLDTAQTISTAVA